MRSLTWTRRVERDHLAALRTYGVATTLSLVAGTLVVLRPTATIAATISLLAVYLAHRAALTTQGAFAVMLGLMLLVPPTILLPVKPLTIAYVGAALIGGYALLRAPKMTQPSLALYALIVAPPLLAWALTFAPLGELRTAIKPYAALAAACYLAAITARYRPTTLRTTIRWVLWISIPIAILAIYQRHSGSWPVLDQLASKPSGASSGFPGRSAGIFGQPVVYGGFCQAMIVIAYFQRPQLWRLVVGLNAVGLLLSGTRGAWLSLGVVLLILAAGRATGHIRAPSQGESVGWVIAGAIAVCLLPVFAPQLINNAQTRVTGEYSHVGQSARAYRLRIGWARISADPVTLIRGRGPTGAKQFWGGAGSVGDRGASTFDNTYLTLWFDTGLIGVLILGGLLVAAVLGPGEPGGRLVLLGLAINAWFYDILGWPATLALVALGVGLRQLSSSEGAVSRPIDDTSRQPRSGASVPSGVSAL